LTGHAGKGTRIRCKGETAAFSGKRVHGRVKKNIYAAKENNGKRGHLCDQERKTLLKARKAGDDHRETNKGRKKVEGRDCSKSAKEVNNPAGVPRREGTDQKVKSSGNRQR